MLPILFESTFLTVYAYPFFWGVAWAIGYLISKREFNASEERKLKYLFAGLFITSWVGAKIFFLIFSHLSKNKLYLYAYAGEFWLGGGFVLYGGLIFGATFLYLSRNLDKRLLPGLIIGQAIGRIGCLFAGCCYGRNFENSNLRHPAALYEIIGLIFLFLIIKRNKSMLAYVAGYAAIRFIVEFFRGDEVRGFFAMGISTSQMIALIILILSGVSFIYRQKLS